MLKQIAFQFIGYIPSHPDHHSLSNFTGSRSPGPSWDYLSLFFLTSLSILRGSKMLILSLTVQLALLHQCTRATDFVGYLGDQDSCGLHKSGEQEKKGLCSMEGWKDALLSLAGEGKPLLMIFPNGNVKESMLGQWLHNKWQRLFISSKDTMSELWHLFNLFVRIHSHF